MEGNFISDGVRLEAGYILIPEKIKSNLIGLQKRIPSRRVSHYRLSNDGQLAKYEGLKNLFDY